MTTSPTDAHTLPPPPGLATTSVGDHWCKSDGCMHLVDIEHRLCPGCEDRVRRGR